MGNGSSGRLPALPIWLVTTGSPLNATAAANADTALRSRHEPAIACPRDAATPQRGVLRCGVADPWGCYRCAPHFHR